MKDNLLGFLYNMCKSTYSYLMSASSKIISDEKYRAIIREKFKSILESDEPVANKISSLSNYINKFNEDLSSISDEIKLMSFALLNKNETGAYELLELLRSKGVSLKLEDINDVIEVYANNSFDKIKDKELDEINNSNKINFIKELSINTLKPDYKEKYKENEGCAIFEEILQFAKPSKAELDNIIKILDKVNTLLTKPEKNLFNEIATDINILTLTTYTLGIVETYKLACSNYKQSMYQGELGDIVYAMLTQNQIGIILPPKEVVKMIAEYLDNNDKPKLAGLCKATRESAQPQTDLINRYISKEPQSFSRG